MTPESFAPGERFHDVVDPKVAAGERAHIWKTLGYERTVWEPGHQRLQWKATEDYAFHTAIGPIIHGGMVGTLLDTAMGGACWTLLDNDEVFLTGDLRVEFLRPTRPGLLSADGHVIRRSRRVVFCAADLFDDEGVHLATARCTQIVIPVDDFSARE